MSYPLFSAFHIIGNVTGRALYGNMSTRYFSQFRGGANTGTIDVNNRFKSFIPELSAEIGLSFNWHFSHHAPYMIFVFAYQYNSLFNQSFYIPIAQNRISALTGERTVQWGGFLGKITFGL